MPNPKNPLAGGNTFQFHWRSGRLVAREDVDAADGHDAADVDVQVEMFISEEQLLCGKVTVSTVPTSDFQRLNTLGDPGEPLHIDSAVWRAIPIGRLIEDTAQRLRASAERVFRELGDAHLETIVDSRDAAVKRGPKPSLTPELLSTIVAPAFRSAGRKPIEAVRAALEAHGYPGSGPGGEVTIDQARKAVTKARALDVDPPLIPAAKSRRQR